MPQKRSNIEQLYVDILSFEIGRFVFIVMYKFANLIAPIRVKSFIRIITLQLRYNTRTYTHG